MNRRSAVLTCSLVLLLVALAAEPAHAIILFATGDPTVNTTTPGDNSGWQYEGTFGGYLGTPIAKRFFLTAAHIGAPVGLALVFHGKTYNTIHSYPDPAGGDLIIFEVDQDFDTWTPLYAGGAEKGHEVRLIGRGTQRGAPLLLNGVPKGWQLGPGDGVERWGSNTVTGFTTDKLDLYCNFDEVGIPNEAHFSSGDSAGGTYILEDGLWKLAGINYAVDQINDGPPKYTAITLPIYDARGYYEPDGMGGYEMITAPENFPTSCYSTRVYPLLLWIQNTIDSDPTQIPPETFAGWLHGYFTPDQISDPTVTGPNADPDGDGIPNLEEYAFNLDPTFPEPAVLTAATGVRGLPLIRSEAIAATGDTRLTIEYVRRTAAGGGGLTYAAQFASDLSPEAAGTADGWQTGGTAVVTPINPRWDRVKVTDSVPAGGTGGVARRFGRVVVTAN